MTLRDRLFARARELGFDRIGIASVTRLDDDAERLAAWIRDGRHAGMEWMARDVEARADPRRAFLPSAKSMIALAVALPRGPIPPGPSGIARVARYAQGRDYHNVVGRRARKLASWLRDEGFVARSSCDTAYVLERAWAARAGLGFVGKNTMLIIPGLGSHVMLACVATSAELVPDSPMSDRCGACTRCLDLCPTQALTERSLDSNRCISNLTIEHDGAQPIERRSQHGAWLFGCDACQDVCPFNQGHAAPGRLVDSFARDARWDVPLARLLRIEADAFDALSEGSPLRRVGAVGIARNAAVVLGNVGQAEAVPDLEKAQREHPSAIVRETAGWALQRIRDR